MKNIRMHRWLWLLALPMAALAAIADDYAGRWPLTLERTDGGAYRVVLDRGVYRQLQSPALRDLVVVNADGAAVGRDKRQVTDQPRVEQTMMRLDMRAGGQPRPQCKGRARRDIRLR